MVYGEVICLKKSKAEAVFKHVRRRFRERAGLDINKHDYNYMVNCIKKRENSYKVCSQSRSRHVIDVYFNELWCRLVYDSTQKKLITLIGADEQRGNLPEPNNTEQLFKNLTI